MQTYFLPTIFLLFISFEGTLRGFDFSIKQDDVFSKTSFNNYLPNKFERNSNRRTRERVKGVPNELKLSLKNSYYLNEIEFLNEGYLVRNRDLISVLLRKTVQEINDDEMMKLQDSDVDISGSFEEVDTLKDKNSDQAGFNLEVEGNALVNGRLVLRDSISETKQNLIISAIDTFNQMTKNDVWEDNILIGKYAMTSGTQGQHNVFLGNHAGQLSHKSLDIGIGYYALRGLDSIADPLLNGYNIGIGMQAGSSIGNGVQNVMLGWTAGRDVGNGNRNVYIGTKAGEQNDNGSENIFIGNLVGRTPPTSVDSTLMIDIQDTDNPLIHGFFGKDSLAVNGELTISNGLTVDGDINQVTTATNDDPNMLTTQARVATTDATTTTLQTIAIKANRTYSINTIVIARRTGGTAGTADDGAAYTLKSAYTTKSGTVTELGALANNTVEDQADWSAILTISGTNVRVEVTGAANNNITWHCTTEISYVGI